MEKREINHNIFGGNTIKLKLGTWIKSRGEKWVKKGDKLIKKGSKVTVLNPVGRLVNPFTLIISFSANKLKYQIILEGNYKEKYKRIEEEEDSLTEQELLIMIKRYRNQWFLKT